MSFYTSLTLLPVLFLAAILDVRNGSIPNELVLLGIALAQLTHLLEGGTARPSVWIIAFLLLLLFLRRFHLIGGGDIKLFFFVIFLIPGSGAASLIGYSFVINAIFGMVLLLCRKIHRFPLAPGIFASAAALHLFGGLL